MTTATGGPPLLLVDDDATFCQVLAKALTRRGFRVQVAHDVAGALDLCEPQPPEYAVVDLRMPGESGLVLVDRLRQLAPDSRVVVLTGYSSIATAVEAIKLGACHYLTKPANADQIVAAFARDQGDPDVAPAERPPSVGRLEWEYLQQTLAAHDGNISRTARALGMHRRTLQRKLAKRPRRE